MHFIKIALSLSLLAGSAIAQLAHIVSPTPGSKLTAGSQTTVQISMDDTLENVDEVAIVIGLAPCGASGCPIANQSLGNVLYQGPFNPNQTGNGLFYENFTVTVPTNVSSVQASLNVLHVFLIGDSDAPTIEYLNENVTIAN